MRNEANRLNALASTGPTDTASTRLNALRHGILSSEALLTAGDAKEDRDLFDELGAALRAQLQPAGALEELLVDKLVMLVWRWRRVIRYETAAIAAKADYVPPELPGIYRQRSLEELEQSLATAHRDLDALAQKHPLRHRPELWRRAFEVAKVLFGTDPDDVLGHEPDWQRHFHLRQRDVRRVIRLACKNANLPETVFWGLVEVDVRHDLAGLERDIASRKAALARAPALAIVPGHDGIDKIRRYEAHLSRQFYRALHELQRLQAARQGHPALPPAALDLLIDSPADDTFDSDDA